MASCKTHIARLLVLSSVLNLSIMHSVNAQGLCLQSVSDDAVFFVKSSDGEFVGFVKFDGQVCLEGKGTLRGAKNLKEIFRDKGGMSKDEILSLIAVPNHPAKVKISNAVEHNARFLILTQDGKYYEIYNLRTLQATAAIKELSKSSIPSPIIAKLHKNLRYPIRKEKKLMVKTKKIKQERHYFWKPNQEREKKEAIEAAHKQLSIYTSSKGDCRAGSVHARNRDKSKWIHIAWKQGEEVLRNHIPPLGTILLGCEHSAATIVDKGNTWFIPQEYFKSVTYVDSDNVLLLSAKAGDLDGVRKLLAKGADVNVMGKLATPLMYAVQVQNYVMVRELLESGALVWVKNIHKADALNVAVYHGNNDIVKLLVEYGANTNSLRKNNRSVLFTALRKNNIEAAKTLIKHGADIHHQDIDGDTLMHLVAEKSNKDTLEFVHSLGLDVNAKNYKARTPLVLAVKRGRVEIVKRLLELGADKGIEDKEGKTVLQFIPTKIGKKKFPVEKQEALKRLLK